MASTIRIGIVGYGGRIHSFLQHCLKAQAGGRVKLVGIVDPDEPGVRERLPAEDDGVRFYPSISALGRSGEIDAVLIGTRCNLHTPYAIEAARLGVPLFVEKPVAISFEQAHALEEAFCGSDAPPTVVSFPLRTSPLCRLAKEQLDEGAVGSALHVAAVNYVPYGTVYWEQGYRDYSITGGLFLQKATHDFDYLMYLLDSPITRVAASAQYGGVFGGDKPENLHCAICDERYSCLESPQNRRKNGSGGSLEDHMCVFSRAAGTVESGTNENSSNALLEFASGAHGAYAQVFYARRDAARRGATISGYHGTLDFDWYRNDLVHVRHHKPFTSRIAAGEGLSHFGGDDELARNFLAVIDGREESCATMEAGIQSVYACLAAREATRSGAWVNVRRVGQV